VTLFLAGDVMTGRGIDQVLPVPSEPELHESYVRDARVYVELAERVNGPIPYPVGFDYVWGDALAELERAQPQARIVNLETSVTVSATPWLGKGINYRMHPGNVGCLTAARVDCCVLANNHVMDWGRQGLVETLATLRGAGLRTAGAGSNAREAAAPARIDLPDHRRVLVFGFGSRTSGIPSSWAAGTDEPGVNLLSELSASAAGRAAELVERFKQAGDIVVVSVHWGGNWGYDVPVGQREFAHALIDRDAADVVHGHSSHHAKAIEVYRGRPILYGCGDFVNDYEGIEGHESFRGDLALMYFVAIGTTGDLAGLSIVPLCSRQFALHRASRADAEWVMEMLERTSAELGTSAQLGPDNRISLRWA
jgi:poly-gamma-glutamate capsule biosynthesis protein CapA/YwtB (metallophosphatase superfamily)